MFYLALTFGLESDHSGSNRLARMAGLVEEAGRKKGIAESLWMTVGVSDGQSIWAVRYASDGDAPTLYYSREMEEVYELSPHLAGRLSPTTRLIVSEPRGARPPKLGTWYRKTRRFESRRAATLKIRPFVPLLQC